MSLFKHRISMPQGLTSSELLVIVAVIAVLTSILLSAVHAAREIARRVRCSDNLKQMGLACQSYETAHDYFPMGRNLQLHAIDHPGGSLAYRPGWSLHAALLPYAEQTTLYNAINFHLGPYQLCNSTVVGTRLDYLWCPNDARIFSPRHVITGAGWDRSTLAVTYASYGGIGGSFAFILLAA